MFQITEQEVRAVVGSKADYYLQRWQLALEGDGKSQGFNWAAFLISGLWLPFRKMYLPTILLFGFILIETVVEEVWFVGIRGEADAPASLGRIVGLVISIICGAFGNQWYLSHVRNVIADTRLLGLPEEEYYEELARRGGTNILAALAFFTFFIGAIIGVLFFLEMKFAKE